MNLNLLIPPTASPRPQSRGGPSRGFPGQGGGVPMSRASNDPNQIFKERFSSINTAKAQIEKQREFDAVKDRLQKEFDVLDINRDGLVTLDELQTFLDNKTKGGRFDPQITEEIYGMIDLNNDGRVTLEEFVSKYLETRTRLNDRINEVYKKIADHKRQRDDMAQKLKQVQGSEQLNENGIMHGSILTVHVVEARDLKPMDMDDTSDPYVILEIENQRIETNYKKQTVAPVWNESFTFDIVNGREALKVTVMNKGTLYEGEFEGQCYVSLNALRDQMKHDFWFDLTDENGIQSQGRIRLMLHWVYSRVQYFSEYLMKWDETLDKDIQEKDQIEQFLKQLENPFGFLDTMREEAQETDDDEEDARNEGNGQNGAPGGSVFQNMVKEQDKKIKQHEEKIIQSIDNISANIAYKLGFNHVPWFTLTKIVLGIYTVLTCFVLFFRTDFINLTVCTAAAYMILNTDKIKKWTFRTLVYGIFLSLAYDLTWFLFIQDFSADQSDGGVEKAIKSFSLSVSYISFFFRIIVAMVFWKDSVDFNRIIVQQRDFVEPKNGGQLTASPDRKRSASKKAADDAINQYKNQKQAPPNNGGNQRGPIGPNRGGGNGFDMGRR